MGIATQEQQLMPLLEEDSWWAYYRRSRCWNSFPSVLRPFRGGRTPNSFPNDFTSVEMVVGAKPSGERTRSMAGSS